MSNKENLIEDSKQIQGNRGNNNDDEGSDNEDSTEHIDSERPSNENDISSDRSLLQRTFGKLGKGSMRGSIFALANVALGTGCLSIARTLDYLGIIPAAFIVFIIALLTYHTLEILGRASNKFKIYNISALIGHIFSPKLKRIYDALLLVHSFGVMAGITVICYDIIGIVLYDIFYSSDSFPYDTQDNFLKEVMSRYSLKFPIQYGISILMFLPLAMARDLSKIAWASIVGILALMYTVLVRDN